ncbi:MAG TPA: DUF4143 domain-containing protein [Euzebyales bacterium]|nr:DUF4143 domain-containing protein [Euzebyales bacterium]
MPQHRSSRRGGTSEGAHRRELHETVRSAVPDLPAASMGHDTARTRAAMPKLHVIDSGLAARLLRLTADELSQRNPTAFQPFGHLLETFVVGEALKQVSWMDGVAGVGHRRTHDGAEVDLVIERNDGSVVAIEVKAGTRVSDRDLAGLRLIRDELGDAFVAGVVVYIGARSYNADDRLAVLPVDRLWTPTR